MIPRVPAPITVAMVGLTHPHAGMWLETLDALDEVGGVVLCDPNATARTEAAARWGKTVTAVPDLAAALAHPGVTHALVAVPTDENPATLVQIIDAGRHVLTEKPGARSAAEFAPVQAALARRPVAFAVAYLNRLHPAILRIRDLFRAGAIGRLMTVEVRVVTTQPRFRDPTHWLFRHESAGGGIVSWLGCHWLDAVRSVTGAEFTEATAQIGTLSGTAIDVEDAAAVAFRLSNGAVGSLHAGYLLASGAEGYRGTRYDIALTLRGTGGLLAFRRDDAGETATFESVVPGWETGGTVPLPFVVPPAPGYGGSYGQAFVQAWLAASAGAGASPADDTDALRLLQLLDSLSTTHAQFPNRRPPA